MTAPNESLVPATGELVPVGSADVIAVAPRETLPTVVPMSSAPPGTLALAAETIAILQEPVADEDVDILPTGEVYLSQIGYRRRLNRAIGPGGWSLVAVGSPAQMGQSIAQRFELWISGHRVAEAYGEADYHEQNPRTTWATAWESAKSNALMRLCKDLGIASECWDRRWTEAFKTRRCVQVWRQGERRPQWRRKDAPPWHDERGAVVDPVQDDRPVEGARPAAAPKASAPPASTNGALRVRSVKPVEGETKDTHKPYKFWAVTFSDGREASTFDTAVADLAKECAAQECAVEAVIEPAKRSGKFNLTELTKAVA